MQPPELTDDTDFEVGSLDPRPAYRHALGRRWHVTLALVAIALAVVLPLATLDSTRAAVVSLLPTPTSTNEPSLIITTGNAATDVAPAVWNALRNRPVRLPALPSSATCPTSEGRAVHDGYGAASGDGPAYIVGLGADGVLHAVRPAVDSSGAAAWGYQFTLFVIDPVYQGPLLARGAQINGSHPLLFNGGLDQASGFSPQTITLLSQLRLESGPAFGAPWPTFPAYLRMLEPGCYAIQIDGVTFSEMILFRIVFGD
ncbi:MAG TPA: hypothetical protein VF792_07705 [Ktedonobacterales bacterium]